MLGIIVANLIPMLSGFDIDDVFPPLHLIIHGGINHLTLPFHQSSPDFTHH